MFWTERTGAVEPGPPDVLTALPTRNDRASATTGVVPISIGGTGSSSGDGHLEVVERPIWNPRARIRRQASQEFQDQVGRVPRGAWLNLLFFLLNQSSCIVVRLFKFGGLACMPPRSKACSESGSVVTPQHNNKNKNKADPGAAAHLWLPLARALASDAPD